MKRKVIRRRAWAYFSKYGGGVVADTNMRPGDDLFRCVIEYELPLKVGKPKKRKAKK